VNFDNIIILDNGRVVEQGKHEELLNLGGIYAEFYEKQHFEHKD
jgi:ABC-type multidrug transport system fused ATPase/permease subunit